MAFRMDQFAAQQQFADLTTGHVQRDLDDWAMQTLMKQAQARAAVPSFHPPPGLDLQPAQLQPASRQQLLPPPGLSHGAPCLSMAPPTRVPGGHQAVADYNCYREEGLKDGVAAFPAAPMRPIGKSITTLVIQNLPGRYTQDDMLAMWPVDGTYDYLHVPYNLLQKRPLGYVFINFLTNELAVAFQRKWHGRSLPGSSSARKPLDVAAADIQGKQENLELIKSRKVNQLSKAGFLPIVLQNGLRLDSKAILNDLSAAQSKKAAVEEPPVRREDSTASSDSEQTTASGGDACTHTFSDAASHEGDAHAADSPMYVLLRL